MSHASTWHLHLYNSDIHAVASWWHAHTMCVTHTRAFMCVRVCVLHWKGVQDNLKVYKTTLRSGPLASRMRTFCTSLYYPQALLTLVTAPSIQQPSLPAALIFTFALCVCECAYLCMWININIYNTICSCACVCVCVHVWVCVCVCVCACVFIRVRLCMCFSVHDTISAIHMYICVYIYIHIHICTYIYICIRIYIFIRIYIYFHSFFF